MPATCSYGAKMTLLGTDFLQLPCNSRNPKPSACTAVSPTPAATTFATVRASSLPAPKPCFPHSARVSSLYVTFPCFLRSVHHTVHDLRRDKQADKYAADEQVIRVLHHEELGAGLDVLALSVRVFYSPSKTNAGYSWQGKTFHLSRTQDEFNFFGKGAMAHAIPNGEVSGPSVTTAEDVVSILHSSQCTELASSPHFISYSFAPPVYVFQLSPDVHLGDPLPQVSSASCLSCHNMSHVPHGMMSHKSLLCIMMSSIFDQHLTMGQAP